VNHRTLLLVCCGLVLGCANNLDVDRARALFGYKAALPAPPLQETPASDLAPVDGLVARSGELRQIPLGWEPVLSGDVAGYAVERAPQLQGPFQRVGSVMGRFSTVWLDEGHPGDGLGDGASFYYRVRAFDSNGRLAPAPDASAAASTAPRPTAPEALRAYSQLPRRVALAWDPVNDPSVAGYSVQRSPAARGDFLVVAHISGRFRTTWVDRGLGDLRVFYYRIAAVNAAGGTGDATIPVRAVTKPEPLPPARLAVEEQSLGRNVLHWEPNVEPDVVRYHIFRRRSGATREKEIAVVDAAQTRAEDPDVGAGEPVFYSLQSEDADGLLSNRSAEIAVVSRGYELRAEPRGNGVALSWSREVQAGFASTRVLEVGRTGSLEIGRAHEAHFEQAGVGAGRTIRYQLVGVRRDGSKAPASEVVEVHVPPAAVGAR